jgi:hypothetical protein
VTDILLALWSVIVYDGSVLSIPRRTVFRIGVSIVIFLIIVIGVSSVIIYPTFKQPPQANFSPPKNLAEAHRQDLEYLKHLTEIDRSFTPETKVAFQAAVADLLNNAEKLDPAALEMGIAKAVALAGNGHTNVRDVAWGITRNSIPIRFAWFAEGLFVLAADPSFADLVGAKVILEGGHTPQELEIALRPYSGGPESLTRALSPHFFESPEALHAAGLLPAANEVSFLFQLQDGSQIKRTIPARPESVIGLYKDSPELKHPKEYWPSRDLSPVRIPNDARKWVHLLDGETNLPLYLRQPETFYWHTYLNNAEVLYLQINATRNQVGKPPLETFLKDVLAEITTKKPKYAIVDLRFNPGGNAGLTVDFTSKLPQQIPTNGKIFIITGNSTFSAGIITAARLKYYSGSRGYIVGERIGDDEQFWAEGSRMILPNSHLNIVYATAYHDWKHGCSWLQIQTCYFLNYGIGVPAGDLSPTIPATLRFSDYLVGEDTALQEILKTTQRTSSEFK